jgi:hypothetical protein
MHCSYCGTHTDALSLYEGVPGESKLGVFCGRTCLRAWLGPDRPLSDRIEAAAKVKWWPQHMVEPPYRIPRREGESVPDYLKRLVDLGEIDLA